MRFLRKLAAAGLATVLAALAFASVGSASTWNPTGEWAPFGECPLSHLPFDYCVDLTVESGSLKLGNRTADIVNPITFQGGEESATPEFIGPEFVETLNKVPQPLTGGLVGIPAPGSWPAPAQAWWNGGIASGFTGVNATIELAAAPSSITLSLENLLFEEGTALGLPVKVHLENTLLGSNCYVGSNAQPIQLALTTGTSGSLHGSTGTLSGNGGFTRLTFAGLKLVDNTFAAPAASGCGGIYSSLVDPLIDSIFGLPASSGESWLILEGDLRVGEAAEVFAFAMP